MACAPVVLLVQPTFESIHIADPAFLLPVQPVGIHAGISTVQNICPEQINKKNLHQSEALLRRQGQGGRAQRHRSQQIFHTSASH